MRLHGVVLDDYEINTDKDLSYGWTQICPLCESKFPQRGIDRYSGHGICGVKNCENNALHYLDFNKDEVKEMNSNIERNFIESFYSFLDAHAECNLANPTHQEEPSIEIQTEELKERLDNAESKLEDVESLTDDHESRLDTLEMQDLEERLGHLEESLEHLTKDVDFKREIRSLLEESLEESLENLTKDMDFKREIQSVVNESLRAISARGQIKIYISSED